MSKGERSKGERSKGGRPPLGLRLVDRTKGSTQAKARLKVILGTLTGERSIESACKALGLEETAFRKLRDGFLKASVEGLERKRPGRKPTVKGQGAQRIETLEKELRLARQQIEALEIREEISFVMPHILRPRQKRGKTQGP